ncbi:MAG: hypothetical protein AAF602_11465 [Myxococcota bacterium]
MARRLPRPIQEQCRTLRQGRGAVAVWLRGLPPLDATGCAGWLDALAAPLGDLVAEAELRDGRLVNDPGAEGTRLPEYVVLWCVRGRVELTPTSVSGGLAVGVDFAVASDQLVRLEFTSRRTAPPVVLGEGDVLLVDQRRCDPVREALLSRYDGSRHWLRAGWIRDSRAYRAPPVDEPALRLVPDPARRRVPDRGPTR